MSNVSPNTASSRHEPPGEAPAAPQAMREAGEGAPDEAAAHELPYPAELRRKALHLLALVLPLGTALLGKEIALLVLGPAALAALAADVLRSRSRRFARLIQRIFGGMMRADEWTVPQSPAAGFFAVRVNGATWTLVTMALLTLLFPVWIAVTAFSVFMVGDAAAALVGRRYGRTPWGQGPRTVEGSVAFAGAGALTVALLVGIGYAAVPWWAAALAVAAAAAAEAFPRPLNDNLRVPFVAALILLALGG